MMSTQDSACFILLVLQSVTLFKIRIQFKDVLLLPVCTVCVAFTLSLQALTRLSHPNRSSLSMTYIQLNVIWQQVTLLYKLEG